MDLHNYEGRLRATLERIVEDPQVRPADKELIADFIHHCQAQGLSADRRFKLVWELHSISQQMHCTFKAAIEDAEESTSSIPSVRDGERV